MSPGATTRVIPWPTLHARVLRIVIMAALVLMNSLSHASRYKVLGGTISNQVVTLSFDTDNVLFKDVTFTGSSTQIIMDVGSMMTGTGNTLQILFCGCTVKSGAVIWIKGGSSATARSLKLVIQNVVVNSGGSIAFTGTMPQNTVVTLFNPSFDLATYSRSFSGIAGSSSVTTISSGSYRVGIMLSSFVLTTGSSFVVSTGIFHGGLSTSVPVWVDSSLTVTTNSILSIRDSDIYAKRGIIARGSITVTTNSVLEWSNVYFDSCTTSCMQYDGTVLITSQSAFVFSKVSADSVNDVVVFTSSFSVTSSSYWMLRGNVITFVSKGIRSSEAVLFQSSSYFVLGNNLFDGSPFSMSLTMQSSSVSMAQCNSAGGSALQSTGAYGLSGLQTAYVCATCLQKVIACFNALSSTISASCGCTCTGIGKGEYCLPVQAPSVKAGCLQTDSATPSEAATQTITLVETGTVSVSLSAEAFTTTQTFSPSSSKRTDEASSTVTLSESAGSFSEEPTSTVSHRTRSRMSASPDPTMTLTLRPTTSLSLSAEIASRTVSYTLTVSRSITHSDVTQSPFESSTMTFSDEPTPTTSCSIEASDSANSHTLSATTSNSTSPSAEAKSKSESFSDEPSHSRSISISDSDDWSLTASPTTSDTPIGSVTPSMSGSSDLTTSRTVVVTKSWEPSQTRRLTPTDSLMSSTSFTQQLSESETPSITTSGSGSITDTPTITETETPSRSETPSISSSWCLWWDPPVNATPPLVLVDRTNETMTIDYYSFSRHGCTFFLPDTGQWYVRNVSYGGIAPTVTVTPRSVAYDFNISVSKPATLYHPQIARDVVIEITFRCAVINHTMWYVIEVPPSYAIAPYNAQQITMSVAAELAMIVTSTTSCAFFATTSITLGVLMMCRPPEEVTEFSILPLEIGDEASKHMRGAIIGNVFVLGCSLVLFSGIVLWGVALYNSGQELDEEEETYLFPARRKAILRSKLGKLLSSDGDGGVAVADPPPVVAANAVGGGGAVSVRDIIHRMDDDTQQHNNEDGSKLEPLQHHVRETPGEVHAPLPPRGGIAIVVEDRTTPVGTEAVGNNNRLSPMDPLAPTGNPDRSEPPSHTSPLVSAAPSVPTTSRRRRALPLACCEALRPSKRFHSEWKRIRLMTGFPLSIGHPAALAVLQPSVAAGVALYRMQASPPDNALGSFAALLGIAYIAYAYWCMKRLYLHMFGEMAYREELPLWFWDDIIGAELRRRLGIYLKKKKRRLKKKKNYKELLEEERRKKRREMEKRSAAEGGEGGLASMDGDDVVKNPPLDFSLAEDKFGDGEEVDGGEKKKKKEVKPPKKLSHSEACIFLGLRMPWYGVLRLVVSGVYGVAAGTPPVQTDVCSLQVWVIALTTIVHTLLLLYFNPFWQRAEQYLSIGNCLSILCMCGCLAVATTSEEDQQIAVDGASVCLFLILGFAIMHGLAHFYFHHKRLWSVWNALVRSRKIPEAPPPPPRPPSEASEPSDDEEEEDEEDEEEEGEDDFVVELQATEMLRKDAHAQQAGALTDLERMYRGENVGGGAGEDDMDDTDFFGMIGVDPIQFSREDGEYEEGEEEYYDEEEGEVYEEYDSDDAPPPPPQRDDVSDEDDDVPL